MTATAEKKKAGTEQYVKDAKEEREKKSVLDELAITDRQISLQFSELAPNEEQRAQMDRVRKAGAAMAQTIKDNTRNCADQSAAIRHVRDAVMTANSAIMLQGK